MVYMFALLNQNDRIPGIEDFPTEYTSSLFHDDVDY